MKAVIEEPVRMFFYFVMLPFLFLGFIATIFGIPLYRLSKKVRTPHLHLPSAWIIWTFLGLAMLATLAILLQKNPEWRKKAGDKFDLAKAFKFAFQLTTIIAVLAIAFWVGSKVYHNWSSTSAVDPRIAILEHRVDSLQVAAREPDRVTTYLTADTSWSKPVDGGMDHCVHWQRQDSVSYQVRAENGNTIFFPKIMVPGQELEAIDPRGAVVNKYVIDRDGHVSIPRMGTVQFRTVGTARGVFKIEISKMGI